MAKAIPQVIILLGPVGAGKSTVGRFLQKELGGRFIAIEEFFMEKFGSYGNYSSNRDQAYQDLEDEIIAAINRGKAPLIFEEIAISPHGKHLVEKFSAHFSTDLVCIEADLDTCKSRVNQRGTTHNFSKSETIVEQTWFAFRKNKGSFKFKAEIWNQDISKQKLCEQLQKIWL